jgi:hypothetical protein
MTKREGLKLFQMIVRDRPVLVYAGHSKIDLDRFIVLEADRIVYKYQGDVLMAANSKFYVDDATSAQIHAWDVAFKQAVAAGDADWDDPAAFALIVDS